MDDGGFSKKRKTTWPLLNKQINPAPSHQAVPTPALGCMFGSRRRGGRQRAAAADSAGGHLAGAAVSALQQRRAARGVCRGVNGCVDTTRVFSSSRCLSQLKLFCDAAG